MTLLLVIAVAAALLATAAAASAVYSRRKSRRVARGADDSALGLSADRLVERVAQRAERDTADTAADTADHAAADTAVADGADTAADHAASDTAAERPSLRDRLGRARAALAGSLAAALERSSTAEDAWTEFTVALVQADVGLAASSEIVEAAKARAAGAEAPERALVALRAELRDRLTGHDRSLARRSDGDGPSVWLFVGVNGTGKTTTIGKLAKREADAGAGVVLAAGDTFRAAAADQLALWAQRSGAHIVRGAEGADPASVVYDAVESAAARGADLVLADTAGRLHTERNLMAELAKVRRVAEKGSGAVTETLLVLDATTGQNGLAQVRQFAQAVDVTGVVLTKLDGSAKGGIVVAVQSELGVPVKLVGLGEGIGDLVEFDEAEFVDALLS